MCTRLIFIVILIQLAIDLSGCVGDSDDISPEWGNTLCVVGEKYASVTFNSLSSESKRNILERSRQKHDRIFASGVVAVTNRSYRVGLRGSDDIKFYDVLIGAELGNDGHATDIVTEVVTNESSAETALITACLGDVTFESRTPSP